MGRGSGERGTQEGGLRTEAGGGCVEKEVWRRYGGGRLGERGWSRRGGYLWGMGDGGRSLGKRGRMRKGG